MKRVLTAGLLVALTSTGSMAADKVLATVNGKKITASQLDRAIEGLPPRYQGLKNNPQFRKMILENMVKEELLYQEAKKEGIDKDPKVQEEIELAKKRIMIQALLRKHVKLPKVEVTEEEAKAFYQKNKGQFVDANGKPIPFKSLKPFIIQSLKRQKEEKAYRKAVERYVAQLEKEGKVQINDK